MNTTDIGGKAEQKVAGYLTERGDAIIEVNWKTKWCEIDIVSSRGAVVYFTEVKYRSSSQWGDGFEYVTKKKIAQMKFAAKMWVSTTGWKGECQLQAASVDAAEVVECVEVL